MLVHFSLLAFLVSATLAIYADEVGVVDWHYTLLGLPRPSTTFFHRPHADSKASLLYTFSEASVLGAVNPKDGSVVWRQALQPADAGSPSIFKAADGQNVIYSAVNGTVQAWNADDGRLIWIRNFNNNKVVDLEILMTPEEQLESQGSDIIVLLEGESSGMKRLSVEDGTVKWSFEDNR